MFRSGGIRRTVPILHRDTAFNSDGLFFIRLVPMFSKGSSVSIIYYFLFSPPHSVTLILFKWLSDGISWMKQSKISDRVYWIYIISCQSVIKKFMRTQNLSKALLYDIYTVQHTKNKQHETKQGHYQLLCVGRGSGSFRPNFYIRSK